MSFWNYGLRDTGLCKCLKSHVSLHPRKVNILKVSKHFCNLHDSSFINLAHCSRKMSVAKSLSFEILSPIINTLTPDEKYFPGNSENRPQPLEMKSSKKLNIFHQHFTAFLKSTFHFKYFEKNMSLVASVFRNYRLRSTCLCKCRLLRVLF